MATVTIEKAYFETLLRRARFHTDGTDLTTPVDLSTVTIPKDEHDNLIDTARQYANLRRNLFQGGVLEETLFILTKDDVPTETASIPNLNNDQVSIAQYSTGGGAGVQDYTYGRGSHFIPRNGSYQAHHRYLPNDNSNDELSYLPDSPEDAFYDGEGSHNPMQPKPSRPKFEKHAKRTVLIFNLAEGTTHKDVTKTVKGGMLLDIYLRSNDHCASVSFLEEAHAKEFFRNVKRYDLYIRGKRVDIRWNDRQFILPGHVSNKIGIGATRNLVIRNRNPKHTERAIRDDLEHIHNLVVISVSIRGSNMYISTNSVHNCMFARTCMMSRSPYKGSKIEWDLDECCEPFIKPEVSRKEKSPIKKISPPLNRFSLLDMNGSEDEEEEDLDNNGITLNSYAAPTRVMQSQ